jgi:hypothetical protein
LFPEFLHHLFIQGFRCIHQGVRIQDDFEGFRRQIGDELHVAEGVVVAEVAVEATCICQELLPLLVGSTFCCGGCFELEKVLLLEVSLKYEEQSR